MPTEPTARPVDDRCPGVLRPYQSGDGALVRLRAPGGRLPTQVLLSLIEYAAEHAAGVIQLTSRGNLQLRGLPDPLPDDLDAIAAGLGLLPSATHEVMRNIIASPFGGPAIAELAMDYDRGLRADPDLARLPGRWLVAIDDGSADVWSEPFDIGYRAIDDKHGHVGLAGGSHIVDVPRAGAVALMLELSRKFVTEREQPHDAPVWNVRDLEPSASIFHGLRSAQPVTGSPPGPGIYGEDLLVGVPLGMLEPAHAAVIAELADDLVITPWRSIVLTGAADGRERARSAGLVTDTHSGFVQVTACVGADHCARTNSPTLAIARDLAHDPDIARVHVSGCARRCGRPVHALDIIDPIDSAQARDMLNRLEATR